MAAAEHTVRFVPAGRRGWLAAAAAVAMVLPMAIWLWGFIVDDALISARYAHHLATGHGYRFNAHGPVSDGVTPLGWAFVLAPFAQDSVMAGYRAAKGLGLLSWLLGAASLGWLIAGLVRYRRAPVEQSLEPAELPDRVASWTAAGGSRWRWASLALLGCSASLGAWSVAGMETGLVLGLACLATVARVAGRDRSCGMLAGAVALLRPEAIVWSLLLSGAPAACAPRDDDRRRRVMAVLLAGAPFAAALLFRQLVFGSPLPLSALAKAPVQALGMRYALSVMLLGGPLAALALFRVPSWVRGLQLAIGGQLLACVLAGGDWMPLGRLLVVALPAVCVCSAALLSRPRPIAAVAGLTLGLAGQLYVAVQRSPAAAAQRERRTPIMEQLRPALARAEVVAAVDIGWLGAVSDATIVDLAGVTDRTIALLPGGHTSKRLPQALLDQRDVDTLVLLLQPNAKPAEPWTHSRFARWVEHDLAQQPQMAERFTVVAHSEGRLPYLILRRR